MLDLPSIGDAPPRSWQWPAGHCVVVSGLPGAGKSTLMRRGAAVDGTLLRLDSQECRERWERRLPSWLPFAVYRPAVRVAHYVRLWRALRTPASLLVHDCGKSAWVRRWLARDARRRGRGLHLVVLDVPPDAALAGQAARGRGVSPRVFGRHQRGQNRLLRQVKTGRLPEGFDSVLLLNAPMARALRRLVFGGAPDGGPERPAGARQPVGTG